MDFSKIDKNFKINALTETNIKWINANDNPIELRGGFYDQKEGIYRRVPKEIADQVSPGVAELSKHTSGIRVRFSTNSPYVAIKAYEFYGGMYHHMTLCTQLGFSFLVNEISKKPFFTERTDIEKSVDNIFKIEKINYIDSDKEYNDIEIHFPLYNSVYKLEIGVKDGSIIFPYQKPYSFDKPLLFYGSSITQGGCSSKPDNQYSAIVAKKLNVDFINLGFSGSCLAEEEMSNYIKEFDPLIFIYDYDHNAPSLEHLQKTHYNLFENFRSKHKKTPVIFISKPDFMQFDTTDNEKRRDLIYNNYLKAKNGGDNNVYFINGEDFFDKEYWDNCTVDGCHPTDLGFFGMAKSIGAVLRPILENL